MLGINALRVHSTSDLLGGSGESVNEYASARNATARAKHALHNHASQIVAMLQYQLLCCLCIIVRRHDVVEWHIRWQRLADRKAENTSMIAALKCHDLSQCEPNTSI